MTHRAGCVLRPSTDSALIEGVQPHMVQVVISPQDGVAGQRRFALPDCALTILEKLEQGAVVIESAQRAGQGKIRLTFDIYAKGGKLEIVTLL